MFFIALALTNLLFTHTSPVERTIDYRGHKVLRLHPGDEQHMDMLMTLVTDPEYEADMWGEPDHLQSVDVYVPPEYLHRFIDNLSQEGITYDVIIEDIQELIDHEEDPPEHLSTHYRSRRSFDNSIEQSNNDTHGRREFYQQSLDGIVQSYARYNDIWSWIDELEEINPQLVQVDHIGDSWQRRPIKMVKIGTSPGETNKPIIWLDAGIHAREWITPATSLYIINELVGQYGFDPEITRMMDTFDWYILPMVNPDGYEYSHDNNRLWRKTRRPIPGAPRMCPGIDPNRNWDFKWRDGCESWKSIKCAMALPCTHIYGGEHPFSDPETRAMADVLWENRANVKAYLSLHAYSQMWLHTWGYTRDPSPDLEDIERVSNISIEAITSVHGTKYITGAPAEILYKAGGTSMDWAHGVAGIKYSFSLELRDRGQYGFFLPRNQIVPTGEETLTGILAMANEIQKEL